MTRQEAIKILAILKAAYPNSYKGMTKEDANGTVFIWANQFADMPASVVLIAVNKLISTNIFPPTISEVKDKMRGLYWEALAELPKQHGGLYSNNTDEISPQRVETLKQIVSATQLLREHESNEPTLSNLLSGCENYLNGDKTPRLE